MMKFSRRSVFLILVMLCLYVHLFCSFVSPHTLSYFLDGLSDEELGIKSYDIPSDYQTHQNVIKVLFPDQMKPGKKYPVLYILPVNPGIWDNLWINGIREAARNDIHNKYQVICVYPHYERMPWFGDHPSNKTISQESHLIKAVVPFVDEHFPAIPDGAGRMLIGFSKSGWGAYSLLLRYPGMFGKAASFDAPLLFDDIYQWGSGLKEVFGNEENFRGYYLPDLIDQRKLMLKGEGPRLVLMGYAVIEDHTQQMHAFLNGRQIPHKYDLRKWDRHTWESGWFPEAVRLLMQEN